MLEDYEMKEARRRVIRAIMAAAKKGRMRRAAKHSDRKRTVAMLGRQLCEAANERMNEQIPESIRKATQIGVINKACASSKEKELLIKKQNDAQDKLARMRREKMSLDKMADLARETQTDHDKTWNLRDEWELIAQVETMLTKVRWSNVPAGDFKTDLFRVFPAFECDATWQATKTKIMKKTGEEYDLGQHIELIRKIAKGESENTIDDTDIEGMTEDEIKRHFVKAGESSTEAASESMAAENKKKLRSVFELFGTELADKKRYDCERTYASIDRRLEEEAEALDE